MIKYTTALVNEKRKRLIEICLIASFFTIIKSSYTLHMFNTIKFIVVSKYRATAKKRNVCDKTSNEFIFNIF